MKEEHLKVAEVKGALVLYVALREEGIAAPAEIRAAVSCYTALKDELGSTEPVDSEEVRRAIRQYQTGAGTPQSHSSSHLPGHASILAGSRGFSSSNGGMAGPAAAGGSGGSADGEVVAELHRQLAAEKAARQRYAKKLEAQAAEWMNNVRSLKATIDTLKARLPQGAAGGGSGGGGMPTAAAAAAAAPVSHPGLAPVTPPSPINSSRTSMAAVGRLRSDMTDKAPRFADDAKFILEVASGEALAPDMDAQEELDKLRLKHEAWNREFKEKLRVAQAALRKTHRSSGGGVHNITASGRINVSSMPDLESFDLSEEAGGEMGQQKKAGLFRGLRR
jgi:hypothetical protein